MSVLKGGFMQGKNIFKVLFTLVVLTLFMVSVAQQSGAASTATDLSQKVISGQLVQKVNAFAVIYDLTLSMNDAYKGTTKLNRQETLFNLFNDTIPYMKLTSALRAFGQFTYFGEPTSKSLFGPGAYSKSAFREAVAPFTAGVGFSPMNAALDGAADDLRSQSGQLAIIVFSDGEDMEGYKPVAVAQKIKSDYGDRVCIYTVLIGESAVGRETLDEIANASQCGFMVTGESISSPEAMADFVEKVFLEAKKPEPVKAVAPPPPVVEQEVAKVKEAAPEVAPVPVAKPAPAPAPVLEKVTIALNIQFDTNKAIIKKKYNDEVKKVADFMNKYPSTLATIEGHTDNVGKEAANIELSRKRAESVKAYLVKNFGIESYRLSAFGFGPNKPVASNKTAKGKQMNRRVEAQFEAVVKK